MVLVVAGFGLVRPDSADVSQRRGPARKSSAKLRPFVRPSLGGLGSYSALVDQPPLPARSGERGSSEDRGRPSRPHYGRLGSKQFDPGRLGKPLTKRGRRLGGRPIWLAAGPRQSILAQ